MGDVPQSETIAIGFGCCIDTADEPNNSRATRASSHNLEDYTQAFTVYGHKGLTADEAGGTQEVFPGYLVSWTAGAANSTPTNGYGWDYATATQTVKFWDYATHHYAFVALANGTPTMVTKDANGRVTALTVPVSLMANATEQTCVYYSRIARVEKTDYAQPVVLRFVPYLAKIRIGFYETIEGYTVSNMTFDGGSTTLVAHSTFPTQSECQIAYDYATDQTSVKGTPTTTASTHNFGPLQYAAGVLGQTSATATFALGGGAEKDFFETLLPHEGNSEALEITCSYTLTNTTTGAEKQVTNVKAIVPVDYARWESGGEYTYVFRISGTEENRMTLDLDAITTWQSAYVHTTKW